MCWPVNEAKSDIQYMTYIPTLHVNTATEIDEFYIYFSSMQSEQINRFLVVTKYLTFCQHSEFMRLVLFLTTNIHYIHIQYIAIGIPI